MPELPDFAEFYGASFESLCVQLYAHTGDQAEAQDVVQEAFCRALSRWHKISQYEDPAAWVRKVAWNLATSRWRKIRTNWTFLEKSQHEHTPPPDASRVDVLAALKELPERQRQAVVLHYLSDVPIAEIAVMTGAAEGTVKSWLHRARTTLDGRLREHEWPPVKAPGSEAARGTVRRRRDRNTLVAVIAMLSAAAVSLLVPFAINRTPPVIEITPSPSVQPSADPSTSASPAVVGAPAGSASPGCVSLPVAYAAEYVSSPVVPVGVFEARTGNTSKPLCPGVRLRINWASYTLDAQKNATLYRSGSLYLDNNSRRATITVEVAPGCQTWFITSTDVPTPAYMDSVYWQMRGRSGPFWSEELQQDSILATRTTWDCPTPTPSA